MAGTKRPLPHAHAALTPPPSLSDQAATLFKSIVSSVDKHHFAPSDRPLLIEYVRAVELLDKAAAELEGGAVVDGKVSPWLTVQEKATRSLVALSGRLRLAPQSRFDRLVAGKNARRQPGALDDEIGPDHPLYEFLPPWRRGEKEA